MGRTTPGFPELSNSVATVENERPDLLLGSAPLVFVAAYAGAGKSHLVRQWRRDALAEGRTVAFFDADADRSDGGITGFVRAAVTDPDALVDLVLIDHADRCAAADIGSAISQCQSAGAQLVLATRRQPSSEHRTSETRLVGPDELQMSIGDARELLQPVAEQLSDRVLEALLARLAGWPAGLQTVSQLLASEPDPVAVAEHFSGRDRALADYFDTEILGSLDVDQRSFLERISVLPVPSGEAANAVTGDVDSYERLSALADAGAMVSRHPVRGYRWQPLARDLLRHRLEVADPERADRLAKRAFDWYRTHHRYAEAVQLAGETGDGALLLEVICEVGLALVADGRQDVVIGWLDSVGASDIERSPAVAPVAAAALWMAHGDTARSVITDWLDVARIRERSTSPPGAASLPSALNASAAAFTTGTIAEGLRCAEVALEIEGPARTPWAALAAAARGMLLFLDDRFDDARRELTAALELCVQHQSTGGGWVSRLMAAECFGVLAMMGIEAGQIDRATTDIAAGELHLRSHPNPGGGHGFLGLAVARLSHHRAAIADALERLDFVRTTARSSAVGVLATVEHARMEVERGDSDRARRLIEAAETETAEWCDDHRLVVRSVTSARRLVDQSLHSSELDDADGLTDREAEVLALLDSDLTRREIGDHLFLAHNTVKTYVQRIYQKLGVSSRPAAVAAARDRGWLS